MSTFVPDPETHPLEDYSKLLHPAGWPKLLDLSSRLPEDHQALRGCVNKTVIQLDDQPMIKSVWPMIGQRLRGGSYAKVVFFCGVRVGDECHQVAVVIHSGDDERKTGLCFVERSTDLTPRCTVRFDPFLDAFNSVLEQVVPAIV